MALQFLFQVVGHVFVRSDLVLALGHCRLERRVLRVVHLGVELVQRRRMVAHHRVHVFLVEVQPLIPLSLSISFWWSASGPVGGVRPHFCANGFMLAVICLCSRTIFCAKAFTAGFVAFFSATSLTAISFWSAWAAKARNFLSSSEGVCAFVWAPAGTIIDATISPVQQAIAIRICFIGLLLSSQPRNRAGTAMLCRPAPTPERCTARGKLLA